ncbi:hypothetical protein JCM31447_18680 [Fluviispira sanaruensis]|uniref:Uncharacterized protein n=1 Tax=Fluviispira sanaruensis TaxID=2493639 RepID=A0A4P2VV76_FLUSA|nr:hypothetical protein JCM31447_18680 [Fluviispira sanaruensis]
MSIGDKNIEYPRCILINLKKIYNLKIMYLYFYKLIKKINQINKVVYLII